MTSFIGAGFLFVNAIFYSYFLTSNWSFKMTNYVTNLSPRTLRKMYLTANSKNEKENKWQPPLQHPVSESGQRDQGITYTLEMGRSPGITWGSDLSFRWVYVLDIEPQGEAALTGLIKKGDYIVGVGNMSLIAQDFDTVLNTIQKQAKRCEYTFFRGKKEALVGEPVLAPSDISLTVKVREQGKSDRILECPGGTNLRTLLVSNGINVYRSINRWTNCNGKQRCGTCIVDVQSGIDSCSRKALDEEAILRDNPDNYRLSCRTSVYGDVTVEVLGAVKL